MQQFKVGDSYKDRRGREIRIIAVDSGGERPVIGVDPVGKVHIYTIDGRFIPSARTVNDLVIEEE